MSEIETGIGCATWWDKPWWRAVENRMRRERAEAVLGVLVRRHPGLRQATHDAGVPLTPAGAFTEQQWRTILQHNAIRATDEEVDDVLQHLGFRVPPRFGAGPLLRT